MNKPNQHEGMDLVARTITGWMQPFILFFGVFLVFNSKTSPGGGFAGGILIACSYILHTLAEGQRRGLLLLGKDQAAKLAYAGALLFLALITMAECCRHNWLSHLFPSLHADFLQTFLNEHAFLLYDIALAIVVSMLLYVIFAIAAAVHVKVKDGKMRMFRQRSR